MSRIARRPSTIVHKGDTLSVTPEMEKVYNLLKKKIGKVVTYQEFKKKGIGRPRLPNIIAQLRGREIYIVNIYGKGYQMLDF